MAAVVLSKPVSKGTVTTKLAIDATSATQRATLACSSRPMASSSTPLKMGNQMARLNNPIFLFSVAVVC